MLTHVRLLGFFRSNTGLSTEGISEDSPLFSSGLLDSFSLMELMTFLESDVGIRIGPDDLTLDNFDTTNRILEFVRSASVQSDDGR